ncbi:hypothetical protein C4L02_15190 [Salmonella enterica]|nr:hypothetical protein [Salmonella enterica]ECU0147704.1 hypothetical protein [Salmonella enterica]
MTKPASTTKNPRKQHTPEFRHEALKQLAERIGVAAAARSGWYVWHQRRHQINRRQQLCLVCDNIVRVVFNTRTIERSPVCRNHVLAYDGCALFSFQHHSPEVRKSVFAIPE